MSSITRRLSPSLLQRPNFLSIPNTSTLGLHDLGNQQQNHLLQSWRGIRVRVRNGNLEQALAVMTRKMVSSGIERLIIRQPTHHIKNSEKRVLARKNLQHRIRSEDLARKLKSILIKKVRGL